MLALAVAAVVEAPQLGALVLGVPLAEVVPEAEHPLLGPGLLLVPAGPAEHGVEPVLLDGGQQRDRLQPVAGGAGAGVLDDQAAVDGVLHAGHDQPQAQLGDPAVPELDDLGEVVPGVDVHDREGQPAGAKAFSARCSITAESLPPENSRTGRSNSAATSRMMWTASASSISRWVSS